MRELLSAVRRLGDHVLGINARNLEVIYPHNPRSGFRTVDDKLLAKEALVRAGVPTPRTLCVIERFRDLRDLPGVVADLPGFVVKPATASGGKGILVVRRDGRGRLVAAGSPGDRELTPEDVTEHVAQLLSGLVTPSRYRERVFLEQLLEPDDVLGRLAVGGLPDIRLIVLHGQLRMAMARVPTRASAGRANLHQGALGVGVDLDTGRTTHAIRGHRSIAAHPDSGAQLTGIAIPEWQRVVRMSRHAAGCVELGYVGVDIILDRNEGPLVVELNARPGLSIQLANRAGLRRVLGAETGA